MAKVVVLKLKQCDGECPHHDVSGGIVGEADWCCHSKFRKPREIAGKERNRAFPSWCPLADK
jgi:hypothetical protein